jgi:pimeloyl-ACP methyl ester carboxylesterase
VGLSYEGCGTTGLPLLLVHGFPLDRTIWRGQLAGLAGLARVVAPDLPGFGATPPMGDGLTPATMDDFALEVIGLADALGFDRFAVAGLSMGGYVALAVRRRVPARVAGLALVDTRAEADGPDAKKGRVVDAERVMSAGMTHLVDRMLPVLVSPETHSHRRGVVLEVEAMMRRANVAGVSGALRGMAVRPDARPDLPHIDSPTMVIVGADDAVTPPAMAHLMAAQIPKSEMAIIPHAGHLSPIERPEAVNAALRKLLRRAARAPQAMTVGAAPPRRSSVTVVPSGDLSASLPLPSPAESSVRKLPSRPPRAKSDFEPEEPTIAAPPKPKARR